MAAHCFLRYNDGGNSPYSIPRRMAGRKDDIMKNPKYELRKITADDISPAPRAYQTSPDDPAVLVRHDNCMMFYLEDDPIPYYYVRLSEQKRYLSSGIVKLGDGPLSPHRCVHFDDLAQKDAQTTPYERLPGSSAVYSHCSENPLSRQIYTEDHARFVEDGILDFTCEYWPVCYFTNAELPFSNYFSQPFTLTGCYEGKPVTGLGQFENICWSGRQLAQLSQMAGGYLICSIFLGIREDGRREFFYGYLIRGAGSGAAAYWLEGEEPVMTEDVTLETEFYPLPYLPADDPTCACKNMVWRFAGKEIHFTGKWGSRRFAPDPLKEKAGASNSFGTWYEGKTPYAHRVNHTFNESMGATVENLKKHGYTVIE